MITAEQMRNSTLIDEERVDVLVKNTYAVMLCAAEKGMHHTEAWIYDWAEHKWLGDIPDAVIEEAERMFSEAGYEFGWEAVPCAGCVARVIKW